MIRFIITALFVILFLILSIPLLIAEWIIGKFSVRGLSSRAVIHTLSTPNRAISAVTCACPAFPSPTSERIAFRRIPRFSMSVITAAISISL